MIFQLKSTILTLALVASLLLPNSVSAVDQQQQLRGSNINSNNSQRVMASFCPQKVPKQDSSCANVLPAHMSSGNCEWHSSSTDSKGATLTKNDYCKCSNNHNYPNPNPNPNQRPTWDCSGDMESSMTIPPVPAPTTPPRVMASFCPEKAPMDGDSCAGVLSATMSSGNCEWHSSSTDSKGADLTENSYCKCTNNGTPKWACTMDAESSMTSPPIAAPTTPPAAGATTGKKSWCPTTVPAKSSASCPLPKGNSSGTCKYWSKDTHGVTTTNVCSCTRKDAYAHPSAPASPFACVQTKS